tara:strand:- start:537 stop:959 length:423 start_codon:yes stop_codon:yes gene_type:complete
MEPNDLSYEEVQIGSIFEFKKVLTSESIKDFITLTGNKQPLHCDEEFAKNTQFNGIIAHGLHVSSYFSTLFGMLCPGKNCLCLTHQLNYKKPVYPNSEILVRGIVKDKIDSVKVIIMKTEILCNGEIVVDGEAKVTLLEN